MSAYKCNKCQQVSNIRTRAISQEACDHCGAQGSLEELKHSFDPNYGKLPTKYARVVFEIEIDEGEESGRIIERLSEMIDSSSLELQDLELNGDPHIIEVEISDKPYYK